MADSIQKQTLYVCAVNRKEAEELAPKYGHELRVDAETHLAMIKAPPTDPFYGDQYGVYAVEIAKETLTK
jgi:hypothetical protein